MSLKTKNKVPLYHKLWFITLSIFLIGSIIYYAIPGPHIVELFPTAKQEVVEEIVYLPAGAAQLDEYIAADDMLNNPSAKYKDKDILIYGIILNVMPDEYIPYFRMIGASEAAIGRVIQVFFPKEYRLIYSLTYGTKVVVHIHCNDCIEYGYQGDLILERN